MKSLVCVAGALSCAGLAGCGSNAGVPGFHATTPAPDVEASPPAAHEPRTPGSRLVVHVDSSVGAIGSKPVVGMTLGLRYRPLEVGFCVLDLQRDGIAPTDRGLVGVGVTALARVALGDSRADVVAGVSALAAATNGATNPDFDGLYSGFSGLAYQTLWRLSGVAQPFAQLRIGVARGAGVDGTVAPFVGLHLGISTPERR